MNRLRVLVVEDNPVNAILFREVLTMAGYEVVAAASAGEAQQRLASGPWDLVVMDIQIPGGGGESVLRWMRDDPAFDRVPVAAVTAQAMLGDRERLLACGFDAYVTKPIDVRRFAGQMAELAATRRTP